MPKSSNASSALSVRVCNDPENWPRTQIEYQGQSGLLWKRPYGAMYEDLGLTELTFGKVGPDDGFDNCIWRLLEK